MGVLNLLDDLGVNPIILSMCPDKPYVNHSVSIINPDNQPILVAGYIKHHSSILEDTGIAKILFDISRRSPISS